MCVLRLQVYSTVPIWEMVLGCGHTVTYDLRVVNEQVYRHTILDYAQ
jgi:hypothetical protein